MRFIGSFAQQALVHLGFLAIGILLVAFIVVPALQGCDTAQANPYQALYEKQIVINDSLQIKYKQILDKVNLIFVTTTWKIDSLKGVETDLRFIVSNFSCDSAAIVRFHLKDYDEYLWIPLNDRLDYILDSLKKS